MWGRTNKQLYWKKGAGGQNTRAHGAQLLCSQKVCVCVQLTGSVLDINKNCFGGQILKERGGSRVPRMSC